MNSVFYGGLDERLHMLPSNFPVERQKKLFGCTEHHKRKFDANTHGI